MTISFNDLSSVCREDAAIRRRQRLQPSGGQFDKIFPPTYPGEGRNASPRHVFEVRRGPDGSNIDAVLIDSVQSQANRAEESLLSAVRAGLRLPMVTVDFRGSGLEGLVEITSLDAPHRVFDAILRDSALDGVPFMRSEIGQAIQNATLADATALLRVSPTALVFGVWNSTGEGGGLGAKFPRFLTSEIMGVGVPVEHIETRDGEITRTAGRRTGSRLDPLGTLRKVEVFKGESGWDTDKARAGAKAKKVRPSEINHGNIAPSVTPLGITMDYAEHVVVISLAGVRRLRFKDPTVVQPAHTYLAALALLAVVEQDAVGYALRSRCDLVPESAAPFELVHRDGKVDSFTLNQAEVRSLYDSAYDGLVAAGVTLIDAPIRLQPQAKLVEIVRRSRELALAGDGGEGEGEDAST